MAKIDNCITLNQNIFSGETVGQGRPKNWAGEKRKKERVRTSKPINMLNFHRVLRGIQ